MSFADEAREKRRIVLSEEQRIERLRQQDTASFINSTLSSAEDEIYTELRQDALDNYERSGHISYTTAIIAWRMDESVEFCDRDAVGEYIKNAAQRAFKRFNDEIYDDDSIKSTDKDKFHKHNTYETRVDHHERKTTSWEIYHPAHEFSCRFRIDYDPPLKF